MKNRGGGVEKRKDRRERINDVNVIKIKVEGKAAVLVDVSKKGLQLIIPFYPKNPSIVVTFELDDKIYEIHGKVHWVSDSPFSDNQFQVGLSIVKAPEEYDKSILSMLELKKI